VLRVGLTGGIGTGKSYVRSRFELRGVPTMDADRLARDAVAADSPALAEIRARFGEGVMSADGTLDRKALASVVFANPARRLELEAIVHPVVRSAIDTFFLEQARLGRPLAVADIPLLFETGRTRDFDAVVVAACSSEEQLRRVVRRDGTTAEDALARIAAQWPIDDKVRLAHYVVRTDGSFAETDRLVDEVIAALRSRAADDPPPPAPAE
jgi:dephospho-CoA kinase